MAVEYEFSRVNPLCICDEDDNLKTQKVEVSMKAWDTTSHGTVLEAYHSLSDIPHAVATALYIA